MNQSISVVINTLNEEKTIARAINSVKWADEILVCDMHSLDETVDIAKKMGAKIIYHKKLDFVEPARNFAISKASNEWVLVLDPDEEIPLTLKDKLTQIISKMQQIDYVRIPRKNLIFGKWMKASMWWPDLNIRLFKKGKVEWMDKIHRPPTTQGIGLDLPADEKLAIIHHNYQTVGQFIERMNRYTSVEATMLEKDGYEFNWRDILEKPLNEFLSRFFANRGYEDGLHGLSLSLLQALSFLVVYLKVWEKTQFKQQQIDLSEIKGEADKATYSINFWMNKSNLSNNPFKRFFQKIKS